MNTKNLTNRFGHIDMLKAIAIICVIAIHTCAPALSSFSIGSPNWYISIFLRVLVCMPVPLFFMCSGALFLNPQKKITLKDIYTKYIPKIIICLIFWAVLYEAFDLLRLLLSNGYVEYGQIMASIKKLFKFNTHFHLYYLLITHQSFTTSLITSK